MDILVCVKQVPGSTNVQVDPVTGVLKRSGIPSKINPYDLYALETALTLTERFGGTVVQYVSINSPPIKLPCTISHSVLPCTSLRSFSV